MTPATQNHLAPFDRGARPLAEHSPFTMQRLIKHLRFVLAAVSCLVAMSEVASAQTTYTWNQTGTAAWTTSTNWTPTRTTPATNDILLFNNSSTTTVTSVPAQTIGQLSVINNTTVNLQASAPVTLSIAGGAGTDLDVQAGSSLNCNAINAITIAVATGATGNILGSMTFSATASTAHRLTSADPSGITFNTGSTFTAGTNFSGNAFGTTNLNTIVFAAGATYVLIAGSNPFGAGAPNSVVVFQSGSTYRHQATATPAASGRTYPNFEVNVSGTTSVSGGSAFVVDNLTITQGTLQYTMTGTPGHAIKGNISIASGATLTFNTGSATTVSLNGTSAQTISGTGTLTTISSFQTISFANTAGVTLQRNIATSGPIIVSSGTLNCGTNVISGTGTFNVVPAATLGIGSVDGITTFPTAAGNIQNLNRIYNTAANYVYNGSTGAQTTGNGLPSTVNSLTINNSSGVTLTNGVTVSTTLTLAGGTFTIGSANTVAIASGGSIAQSGTGGIAAGSSGGLVSFAGTGTVSGVFTFNNVDLAGAVNFGSGPTTIGSGGTLTINSGGSVSTNAPTYHVASILKYNTGGPITRGTEWGNVTSGQGYPGNVQISNNTTFSITTPMTGDASVSKEMAGSLTVDLGSTFDLTGMNSFTFCKGSATNNGTFTGAVSQIGQFRLSGNWTNNGTYNNGGGTAQIWFDGAGVAQTLGGSTVTAYGSLQINNSLGVTVNTALTATQVRLSFGPFNNGSNVTLTNGALIFRSSGTFGSVPTFGTTVNVTYGNSSGAVVTDKELPTDPTVLNNLTNSNTSFSVTLGANVTVNGTLTLTADLNTGAFVLTENGTSSGAGDVIGDVMRTDLGVTPKAFGNLNNQITMVDATITTMTVNLDKGHSPTDFPQSVLRNYTLTPGSGTVAQATVRLRYLDSELNSNIEDSTLTLWRQDGSTWNNLGQSAANTTDNWVEWDQVDAFSPWTISGPSAPTAVKLTRFNAASFNDGVTISWESGFEVNNLGYHIYRLQNGVRTRVTPSPVAGSALIVGPGARMTAGHTYSWFDPNGTPGSSYYLESIDLSGAREVSGPVNPSIGAGFSPRSARRHAMLLSEMANKLEHLASVTRNGSYSTDRPAAMKAPASAPAPNASSANAANLKTQQAIAAGRAVKITVPSTGWYRVTQAELLAAGLDPNSDPKRLQLFVAGEELPIRVNGDQARLGANDSIEFYGIGLNTPTTGEQVYWLVNGATPGKRISSGKRSKVKPGDTNWADGFRSEGGFAMTTERRDKLVYFSGLLNGEGENIFGPPVTSDPLNQVLTVKNMDREGPAQAQVSVTLQGLTAGDHSVAVQLNGNSLGTINFQGLAHPAQTFSVNRSLIHEGDNVITLTSTNGEADVSLVDTVALTYGHAYRADDNVLRFSATSGQPIMVSGFSSPDIRVIDVTNPDNPNDLGVAVGSQGSGYAFKLQPAGPGTRTFVAFTDDLAQQAITTANQPSTLNATRSADMLIVTHKDFRAAVEPLAAQRRSEGLQVAVVDIEDVYDEFSFGAHTPYALRDFIGWVGTHWQRAPHYLLLAGDSSWDPRNLLQQGNGDFVPTKLIDTAYLETASDDWLADFNGDGAADIAVGRLPGRTANEVGKMVSKILLYEQERQAGTPARGALMVADTGFEGKSGATAGLLPGNIGVQTINRSDVGSDDVMRGQIVDGIDGGPMIVNYYGHGSVTVWTGAGLLDSDLALGLTNNNKPSLFVMMTCLNGYAHDAYIDSLAESLLKSENGGAMAVWASSGFTQPEPQFVMNQMFYQQLFSGAGMRLGDAVRAAKGVTADSDVRRTWMLLGDPSMRLR